MKKALIVYGGWEGHSPKETSEFIAADLRAADFDVTMSDSLSALLDGDKLRTYDLIVPNWTMGGLEGDMENNLANAIEAGTGLGGFHGGMGDAFRVHCTFQFVVGGQFVAHPDNGKEYTVNIVKKDDPIVAGLKDFKVNSEQYYMHTDPANEVIASTVFQTKSAPWINGTVMPVIWKRKHGQGRVFYNSVGHNVDDFKGPEIREINKRGLIWAAR